MVCSCSLRLIPLLLQQQAVVLAGIRLGSVDVDLKASEPSPEALPAVFESIGFPVVVNRDARLVEQIKVALVELIQNSSFQLMARNSDFLVEKFGMSYPHLSNLFSKQEGITLERFIILQKIEKVKELISYGELSLSEIAFMMGYSSVQYLSKQFKQTTGNSVSEFRKSPQQYRLPIDRLI